MTNSSLIRYTISLFSLFVISACKNVPSNVKDIDGNVYKTVKIGKQIWMAENLRVTNYRNGDPIFNISDNIQWSIAKTGAYCNYNNNDSLGNIYGGLYNWHAIIDSRNIAPKGWHIPSSEEMQELINYLGGESVAGGRMKEKGTSKWLWPNTGASNISGFCAIPGGYRLNTEGSFHTLESNCYLWTTTESYEIYSWSKQVFYSLADENPELDFLTYGFSVRCIKD